MKAGKGLASCFLVSVSSGCELTGKSIERCDWQLHVNEHEILTEAVESNTGVDSGEE